MLASVQGLVVRHGRDFGAVIVGMRRVVAFDVRRFIVG